MCHKQGCQLDSLVDWPWLVKALPGRSVSRRDTATTGATGRRIPPKSHHQKVTTKSKIWVWVKSNRFHSRASRFGVLIFDPQPYVAAESQLRAKELTRASDRKLIVSPSCEICC